MDYDREFLTGTVGVLILSLLCEREMYGYEMLQEAERRSASALRLKEGTLYPALHQMERSGLLKARWRDSESGRAQVLQSDPQGTGAGRVEASPMGAHLGRDASGAW